MIPYWENTDPAVRLLDREQRHVRGTTIWYAALNEAYGAWEASWEEESVRYAVWAASSPYLDGARFRALIEDLQAA